MPPPVRYGVEATAAAAERNRELGAQRAAADPAKLDRATRIVRLALARGLLTLADLGIPSRGRS